MKETAAHWIVRLSDPGCSAAERQAFEAWRDADPHHEVAFEREAAAWDKFDRLRALRPVGGRPDADLLAPKPGAQERRRAHRRRAWAIAASVAGLVVAAAVAIDLTAGDAYATGVGERRVVILKDGSRLELNTDTRVVVRYWAGAREVKLVRGEALIRAAKAKRPLVVEVDHQRFSAADAQLAVRLRGRQAEVTVTDGTVMAKALQDTPLTTGAEAVYGRAAPSVVKVSAAEIERSLAWRQDAVAFNGQSLAEAIDEFNRYNHQKLVIVDGSIATLRVAGYFQSSDLPGFVQAVTTAFPVRASKGEDGTIRLSRAG